MTDMPAGPGASRSRLHDTLVGAARELTVAYGWEKVRMADVAKAAGVSRQTVYNEFGNRDGLAEAVAISEIRGFVGIVRAELFARGGDARAAGRATILRVLTEAAANPLILAILAGGAGGAVELLPYLTTRSTVLLEAAGVVVGEWIGAHRPDVDRDGAALAAESIIRLTVSHVVHPSGPPEATAEHLAEVFVRLLG